MTATNGGGAPAVGGARKVMVTGASGQLGCDLRAALAGEVPDGGAAGLAATGRLGARRPAEVLATDVVVSDGVQALDITDRAAVLAAAEGFRPDVILHGAAWTAVDACEGDPDRAFAVNALATRHVAEAARRVGAHLVYVSTDYVFDGTLEGRAYDEWDAPNPQSVYGRSKLGGELEVGPETTVVRTSWVSGAHGANMVHTVLRLAAGDGPLRFVDDQHGCPTFTADLAGALLVLAEDRRPGIFHVTNQGPTTWFDFVRAVLEVAGGDPGRVSAISTAELDPPRPAPRPANSVLDNAALRLSGLELLPDWRDALERLVRHLQVGAPA